MLHEILKGISAAPYDKMNLHDHRLLTGDLGTTLRSSLTMDENYTILTIPMKTSSRFGVGGRVLFLLALAYMTLDMIPPSWPSVGISLSLALSRSLSLCLSLSLSLSL